MSSNKTLTEPTLGSADQTQEGRTRVTEEKLLTAKDAILAAILDRNYLKSKVEDAQEITKAIRKYFDIQEMLRYKYNLYNTEQIIIREDMLELLLSQLELFLFMATYTQGFTGSTDRFLQGVQVTFDDLLSLGNVIDEMDMVEALINTQEIEVEMFHALLKGVISYSRVHYKDSVQLEFGWLGLLGKIARTSDDDEDEDEDEDKKLNWFQRQKGRLL